MLFLIHRETTKGILMKLLFAVLLAVCGLAPAASAQNNDNPVIVFAEGQAYSRVAEYVVLDHARARMRASARQQCANLGFSGQPAIVPGSGYCQANYGAGGQRIWYGHCYSDFTCQ
jgi:hypothetical protein